MKKNGFEWFGLWKPKHSWGTMIIYGCFVSSLSSLKEADTFWTWLFRLGTTTVAVLFTMWLVFGVRKLIAHTYEQWKAGKHLVQYKPEE